MNRLRELYQRISPHIPPVHYRNYIWLVLGPLVGIAFVLANVGGTPKTAWGAYATWIIAFYWMTECLPIAVTALLPVVLFPLFGVTTGKLISAAYFNDTLMLLLGSFIYAATMEKWKLHRKLALKFLLVIGQRPLLLTLGFMLITGFLSMWISNTACTSMMVPLVLAVIGQFKDQSSASSSRETRQLESEETMSESYPMDELSNVEMRMVEPSDSDTNIPLDSELADIQPSNNVDNEKESLQRFSKATLLGVAYSASIGGVSTLIGTGTNVIFTQQFLILFPEAPPISFGKWFLFCTPLAIILILCAWGVLWLLFMRNVSITVDRRVLEEENEELGPFNAAQVLLLVDLGGMVFFWFTRTWLEGWGWFPKGYVTDGTISMFFALALFLLPSFQKPPATEDKPAPRFVLLADNHTLLRVPWDIVLLLGGGMAVAEGFTTSGLSRYMATQLHALEGFPMYLLVTVVSFIVLFTTELTSNTATVTLTLPVLAALAVSIELHPLLLMIPATICCSLAFMLPVATPPNAVAFASGELTVLDMARAGFLLNIISLLLVPAALYVVMRWEILIHRLSYGVFIFGVDPSSFPDWAHHPNLGPSA